MDEGRNNRPVMNGTPANNRLMNGRPVPPVDEQCSVCRENFRYACQTDCSHWFCAPCIALMWQHESPGAQPCRCPLCRRPIRSLVPAGNFFANVDAAESSGAFCYVQAYNRLFGNTLVTPLERLIDLPFFWRRFVYEYDPTRTLPLLLGVRFIGSRIVFFIQLIWRSISILRPNSIFGIRPINGFLDSLIIVLVYFTGMPVLNRASHDRRHGA